MEAMNEKRKTNKKRNATLAAMAVVFAVSLMCSCAGGKSEKAGSSEQAKASAGQTAVEQVSVEPAADGGTPDESESPKAERRTVQLEPADGEDGETVMDFGSGSVFGGIEIETDENGELVCTDEGSFIRYKVTDQRFGSYNQLSRFVRKSMSSSEAAAFLKEADVYFITSNGSLYFVDGSGGRTISASKRYVMSGGSTIRVSSTHTPECRKKYGITRSTVDFVKSDGTWKLDSMRNS